MSFADSIKRHVADALPAPQIMRGVVSYVGEAKVLVAGIADQPVACDWSSTFAAELAARAGDLVGAAVEVHYLTDSKGLRQPVIAYTITLGDK